MSTESTSIPRTRTGCQSCRVKHLKCDEQRPSCSKCAKSGIECIRGYNVRFRHGANPSVAQGKGTAKCDYGFSANQTWLKPSNILSFIDETQELLSIYDRDSETETNTPLEWTGSNPSGPDLPSATFTSQPNTATKPSAEIVDPILTGAPALARLTACSSETWTSDHVLRPGTRRSDSDSRIGFAVPIQSPKKRRKIDSHIISSPYEDTPLVSSQHPVAFQQNSPSTSEYGASPPAFHHRVPSLPLSTPGQEGPPNILSGPVTAFGARPGRTTSLTSDPGTVFSTVSDTLSKVYLESPVWPLEDKGEAGLMRYFVEQLAPSFDLCDAERHFAFVVPQRAAVCPTLLNAVFATSARHLSRVSAYDPYIADRYHQECLKHLIPTLSDSAAIMDENLLAATIVLRYLEEVNVPLSGSGEESHLLGTHVFISAQDRSIVLGGLRKAASFVGLRQEIYVAFVNQRAVAPALIEHCSVERTLDFADDCTWANRIISHVSHVLNYCFGDGDRSPAAYNQLVDYCDNWMTYKPSSFLPIYYRDPDEAEVFPEIWLLGDAVACAHLHWHLAKILLTAHNPKIPRLGPGQRVAVKNMDDEIKSSVRAACGMAISNSKTPPNWVTACMTIALCGDRFTDRMEQEALLGVLHRTENDHAWPTGTAAARLKQEWGWVDVDTQQQSPAMQHRVSDIHNYCT